MPLPPLRVLATDSFIRANQNPINTNWKVCGGGFTLGQILNNQYVGQAGLSCDMVYDGGISWPNNQFAQATLQTLTPGTGFASLRLRSSTGANTGYTCLIDGTFNNGGIGKFCAFNIFSSGGNPTVSAGTTPAIVRAGDVFTATVIGNIVNFYQNGVLGNTMVDLAPTTSGKVGIAASPDTGLATDVAWINWSGGGIAQSSLLRSFGIVTVPTAGIPVQVSPTPTNCNAVYFQALSTNLGKIYIGLKNLKSSTLVGGLRVLMPPPVSPLFLDSWNPQGRTAAAPIDLSALYVDVDNSGEGVEISYLIA
jgi:hypothetical protein